MYAPNTCALYREVCSDVRCRPEVCLWPRRPNGRLWEASIAAFQELFGSVIVSGWWFHHSQAVLKRVNKLDQASKITRTATTSRTLFAAWVCYCCRVVAARYAECSYLWCCVFKLLHWVYGQWRCYNCSYSCPFEDWLTCLLSYCDNF